MSRRTLEEAFNYELHNSDSDREENKRVIPCTFIKSVIEAIQALPNMNDDLVLEAIDFLEDENKATIFMALDVKLRRKWLLRKLPNQMEIFVKDLQGETFSLYVFTSDKTWNVKVKIEAIKGVPMKQQRLIFGGRQLEDDRKLDHYYVQMGSTICLIRRLCGC